MEQVPEPQGIGFFSVKSGETHYAKLEPTIAAYINSSDMGINASRGQDFGWRLDPEWVKRVRAFRRDRMQMQILTAQNAGQKPTTVQILYFLYGEELRAYHEDQEEHENPFEEQYRQDTASDTPSKGTPTVVTPAPLPSGNDVPEDLAEEDLLPSDEDIDVDAVAEAATSESDTPVDQVEKTSSTKTTPKTKQK